MPDTKLNSTDDRRIQQIRPLIPPQILYEDYPLSAASEATVSKARSEAENVVCVPEIVDLANQIIAAIVIFYPFEIIESSSFQIIESSFIPFKSLDFLVVAVWRR